MRNRGFSLIEVSIAMACSLLLVLAASTIATTAVKSQLAAIGKQGATQQNSEIKDLLFSLANNAGTSTCVQRMGLTGNEQFVPGQDFDLVNLKNQLQANPDVQVNSIYLTGATLVGSVGVNAVYTAQLRATESLRRGTASAIAPVTLGAVNLTVDSAGRVLSCNADIINVDPMSTCTGSSGTVANTTSTNPSCFMAPQFPQAAPPSCPPGTIRDPQDSQRCIPGRHDCLALKLGDKYDGNLLGCGAIPATYAIRYPANYTPPTPTTTQPTTNTPGGSTVNASTPPTQCTCGYGQIPAGSTSQKCVMGWNTSGFFIFGSTHDYFQVQRCNTAGSLEPDTPNDHVYNSEGNGVDFSWQPGSCYYYGGYKNVNGVRYSTGNCQ